MFELRSETDVASAKAKPVHHGRSRSSVVHVDDPELIEKYQAMGCRIYQDGEWEEIVRKSPLTKLERLALEGYFNAKGSVVDVKGAGPVTNDRLAARGYIVVVKERGAGRVPYYGITPAGEAEWCRLRTG